MPRIDLSGQGFPWWGRLHPDEMNVMLNLETGAKPTSIHHPRTLHYLGHEVNLETINLHSFYSQTWRVEAGRAIADLLAHCEAQPYADQIWGWHLCDGSSRVVPLERILVRRRGRLFPRRAADSAPGSKRPTTADAQELSQAWGREVTSKRRNPRPQERFQARMATSSTPYATVPLPITTNPSAMPSLQHHRHLPVRSQGLAPAKLITVFYGYQMINMPGRSCAGITPCAACSIRLRRRYRLPALVQQPWRGRVPHPPDRRRYDRRAGKIYFDEIDCKTAWTPDTVTWKRHSASLAPRQAHRNDEERRRLQIAAGTAQWWMDLTDNGCSTSPRLVEPLRRLKASRAAARGRPQPVC